MRRSLDHVYLKESGQRASFEQPAVKAEAKSHESTLAQTEVGVTANRLLVSLRDELSSHDVYS